MAQVLIVQRYVPAYRVPLFSAVHQQLADRGHALVVAHGSPSGTQRARGDTANSEPWSRHVSEITLNLPGGLSPSWKRLGSLVRGSGLVVVELASTSLNSWMLVTRRPSKTILWGHGKSYVKAPSAIDNALEGAMARRASHVLTYTEGGRRHLLEHGLHPERVTAIGNSTDTVELRRLRHETVDAGHRWRARLGDPATSAMFVGGLDRDKRIDLLLAAARAAHDFNPGFRLVVAGSGADQGLLDACRGSEWLVHVARASPRELAALSHACSAVWMPGRIGLIAVDALALGLPVFTTDFPFHAPEAEYLVEGVTRFTLPSEPASFAQQALALMARSPSPLAHFAPPTVEEVAQRMVYAILDVLDT